MKRQPRLAPSPAVVGSKRTIAVHPVVRVRVGDLEENPFNPNYEDDETVVKLRQSLFDHGLLENLVTRKAPGHPGKYQILGGAHRTRILLEVLGADAEVGIVVKDPCDDAEAMIVNQLLNGLRGRDVYARKADLYAELNKHFTAEDLAKIMPDDAATIRDMLAFDKKKVDALLDDIDKSEAAAEDSRTSAITFGVPAREEEHLLSRIRAFCEYHDLSGANSRGKLLRLLVEQEWRRVGGAS